MKKLLAFGIAFIMLFSIVGVVGCGGDDHVFQEGDFKLTVTADRTAVMSGGTVEFTVRLENVSGRDVVLRGATDGFCVKFIIIHYGTTFAPHYASGRPRLQYSRIIESGESITYVLTRSYRNIRVPPYPYSHLAVENIRTLQAIAYFETGRRLADSIAMIFSEPIKIYLI